MSPGQDSTRRWTRRIAMRAGVTAGTATLGLTPTAVRVVGARQSEASITVEDQQTDGETVVVAEASVPVEARLLVVAGRSQVFAERGLETGASVTDRTVELSTPIRETRTVRAELRTTDGADDLLARDEASIAVGESLESAQSTVRLPTGEAEVVDPDPEAGAGFRLPYLLFRPSAETDDDRPLFVHPLNGPPVETRGDLDGQLRSAARSPLFRPAVELRLPGVVPGLPRTRGDGGDLVQSLALPSVRSDEALDRAATEAFPAASLRRVDRQLTSMLDDARDRLADERYTLTDGIHMSGFSASAQFSARFAFLYPGRVDAISIGGNGAYPLPQPSLDGTRLPYPLGTADYEAIGGRAFDRDSWTSIEQFVYVGREDQPLPETDSGSYYSISERYEQEAVEAFGRNRVTERLPVTRAVYEDAGATTELRIYDGVGHRVTDGMAADVLEFHRTALGPSYSPTATATPTTEAATSTPATSTPTTAPSATRTTSNGSGPGFGVTAALASLGANAVLLTRRLSVTDDQQPDD